MRGLPSLLFLSTLTLAMPAGRPASAQDTANATVLGTNAQLADGTDAMLRGDWQQGIQLTLQGLSATISVSDRAAALANLCAAHAALKQFADDINNTGKINISVTSTSNNLDVAKDDEIHIYRVVQEAIHNTLKHARASQMKIDFRQSPGEINVTIGDNGIGYHYDSHRKNSLGLGLKNIISRVEMLNGEIFIDTEVGKGTLYSIIIPNAQNG